jgi:CheY-like chemotaxis protein
MRSDSTHASISVTDTGRGIHQSFLPHVFDRFRQADSSSTRSHSGLGIGLAIVRHIVELHGGTVTAQSGGEGAGSTFSVTLPILVAPLHTGEHKSADHAATLLSRRSEPAPDVGGAWVLLVEDVDDSREVLSRVLSGAGANVIAVGSVAEALAAFGTSQVDLLVSDIGMPEQDGYALINRIRELPANRGGNIPAIALTAYARDEDRIRILAAGFQAHVAKPVEPEELIRLVAQFLHDHRPAEARDGDAARAALPHENGARVDAAAIALK